MQRRNVLTCRDCGKDFVEPVTPSRGFRNQCPECSEHQEEPELVGGNMIYEHKTGAYCELKTLAQAKLFARRTRRLGAGVCSALVTPKEPKPGTDDLTAGETESRAAKQDRRRG